jgi:hypothetical protein
VLRESLVWLNVAVTGLQVLVEHVNDSDHMLSGENRWVLSEVSDVLESARIC